MANQRYNRWQGLAIAQLSVAVALISGLSVAGLGGGLSLIQKQEFIHELPFKLAFGCSMLLLFLSALFSCAVVVTRLLDFRLTARQVRKESNPKYDRPLTIFWLGPDVYGRATWRFFWTSCICFALGVAILVACVGATYAKNWQGIAFSPITQESNQNAISSSQATSNKGGTDTRSNVTNVTANPQGVGNPCNAADCKKRLENSWWEKLWTDPIATFTGALFLATASLIGTGLVQWIETRSTAKKQLRAYVGLEDIYFRGTTLTNRGMLVPTGDDYAVKIRIRNHGATPAHRMTIWANAIENAPSSDFDFPYPDSKSIVGEQMLHPNQHYSRPVVSGTFSRSTWGFYVYGRLVYQDIYKSWWITKFCYLYEAEDRFVPYGQHNREDGPYKRRPT